MASTPDNPSTDARWRRRVWLARLVLVAWIAYLIVPVEGWGLFAGRPLGLLSTVALAAVCWTTYAGRDLGSGLGAALALVLKIGLGLTLLLPRGFEARYYAQPEFAGAIEPSADRRDGSATRIDPRLRFGAESSDDVPLGFLNDLRFNYYRENEPTRATLPFSVTWQGLWYVSRPGVYHLYVRSPGGSVLVIVGNRLTTRLDPIESWQQDVTLERGWHRLTLGWSVPQGGARRFEAGYVVDGRERAFDRSVIFRRTAGGAARAIDTAVRIVSVAVDAFLLAWLAVQFVRAARTVSIGLHDPSNVQAQMAAGWAMGVADALVFAMPALGRMITLSGGDDWLTYESLGRDILLRGVLMTQGAALGHGTPFYAQPLYPYFLALQHWLFGDGLFGVYFMQRLMVAGTVIALWRTAARLFGEPTGIAALFTAVIVAYEKLAALSGVLLTEALFVPLVCVWLYLLVRLGGAPEPRRWAVAAGLVGGVTTLARSSLLLGWVFAVPAVLLAMPRRRSTLSAGAILVCAMLAVTSLATIRNWVVARQVVFITSEGETVLFLGNSPPPLTTPPAYKARYERLGLDPRTQAVVEYARQQPSAFARGLWRKARFTLGWFDTLLPRAGTSVFYVVEWMVALVGLGLLLLRPTTRADASTPTTRVTPLGLAITPFLLAASHFAVVVLYQPHVYGDRLIMPLYVLLVPVVAVPIASLARSVSNMGIERLTAALWTLLLGIAVAQLSDWLSTVDVDVFAVALLGAGICRLGLPTTRSLRRIVYSLYAAMLVVWFLQTPTAASAWTLRHELLFVALALTSWIFIVDDTARRGAVWILFGLAAAASARLGSTGFPGPLAFATASLRNVVGYGSVALAGIGLFAAAVAGTVPARSARTRRMFVYLAAAALTFAALHQIGALVDARVAFLRSQLTTLGVVGAAVFVVVWLEGAWPSGARLSSYAVEGMILGTFIATLFGAQFGAAAGALSAAAGLLFAGVHADRRSPRVSPDLILPTRLSNSKWSG